MADADVSLGMNAQELYNELLQVTNKFHQFANQTEGHGQRAGSGFLNGFKGAMGGIGSALGAIRNVFAGTLGAIGVSFGIHTIVEEIKSVIHYGDEIADLARRYGVSTQALSALGFQAQKTGADMETLGKGLGFVEKNREKALGGNEQLQKSFANLGISMKDLQSLNIEQLLVKIGNSSLNAADLMAVMGRSALSLRPLLDDIGRGVVDFSKGLNDADARKLDEVADSFITLKAAIITNVGPAIAAFFKALPDMIGDVVRHMGAGAERIQGIFESLKAFVKGDLPGSARAMEEANARAEDILVRGKDQKEGPEATRPQRNFGVADNEAEEEEKKSPEEKEFDRNRKKLETIQREKHLESLPYEQRHAELQDRGGFLARAAASSDDEKERVRLKLEYYDIAKQIAALEADHAKDLKEHERQRTAEVRASERAETQRVRADERAIGGRGTAAQRAADQSHRAGRGGGSAGEAAIQDLFNDPNISSTEFFQRTGRIDARAKKAQPKSGLQTGHVEAGHLGPFLDTEAFHDQFRSGNERVLRDRTLKEQVQDRSKIAQPGESKGKGGGGDKLDGAADKLSSAADKLENAVRI